MSPEPTRVARVAESIRRELAPLLQAFAADRRLGLISITAVDVSRDLAVARVWVTQLGGDDQSSLLAALAEERARCRRHLARRLRLRSVPRIEFRFDPSVVQAVRVSSLLAEADAGAPTAPETPRR